MPLFRLAYSPILLAVFWGIFFGKYKITFRLMILGSIILGIILVLGFDLLRMDNVERYGKNMFNHVLFLTLVIVIVLNCKSLKCINSIVVGFFSGSILSLVISWVWFETGQLPFPQFVTLFAGTDNSLNLTQFTATGIPRVSAAFFDPNFYGMFLIIVIGMAINKLLFSTKKILYLLILFANVLVLFFTMSRTSMIGLGVVLAVSFPFIRKPKYYAIVAFFLICFFMFGFMVTGIGIEDLPVLSRFAELSDRAGRLPYHYAGIEAFSANPIFGCGNDGLLEYLEQYSFFGNSSAHLVYLSWLAKYGIVGAMAYFVFLFFPLVYALREKLVLEVKHLILVTYLPLITMYMAYDYFESLEIQYFVFGIGYSVFVNKIGVICREGSVVNEGVGMV